MQENDSSIYALLIACDFYFPNISPDETMFYSLRGCVNDINRVEEEFLKRKLNVPQKHILKLQSSYTNNLCPPESESKLPTYENIIKKFQKITELAEEGDQIYIHYSGHGGRALTAYPELKDDNGIDEVLVPIDIEDVSTRYVRDLELARLIKDIVDKGTLVTVVLDSCHSGGMTRKFRGNSAIRGVGKVDCRKRPTDSDVSDKSNLIETWQKLCEKETRRNFEIDSGWLPNPEGYTLLAACRQDQSAIECAFGDNEQRNGALTYWLLHFLRIMSENASWEQLYNLMLGKFANQFEKQTPQLQGETDQCVFGKGKSFTSDSIRLLQSKYVYGQEYIELNTGESLGTTLGAKFAIYPADATDLSKKSESLAFVEIVKIGATKSWAKIRQKANKEEFQGNEQAVLIDLGETQSYGSVHLNGLSVFPKNSTELEAMLSVKGKILNKGKGFLKIVESSDNCNYQVTINENNKFEISDEIGTPFSNLQPDIDISEKLYAEKVVERLIHLVKYHTVEYLRSPKIQSPIVGKLSLELFAASPDAKSDIPPVKPQPLVKIDDIFQVKEGERIYLHIRNNSKLTFNIVIFLLNSDWSIIQILPSKNQGEMMTLEPGERYSTWKIARAMLPSQYKEGLITFKVFATLSHASFRHLELSPLNTPTHRSYMFSSENTFRLLNEWITSELTVKISR